MTMNATLPDSTPAYLRASQGLAGVVFMAGPLVMGLLASLVTRPEIAGWYATINKPSWNPPNWLFGPVWSVLYLMMGFAAFLVWREGRKGVAVGLALALFGVQLLLNGIWSPAFFGLNSPGAGLIVIVPFWLALVATVVAFFKVKPMAGGLLLPYLAWVSFAGFLNATIYSLN